MSSPDRMPPVWRGRRRALVVRLVLLGLLQAALALVLAYTVEDLLGETARFNGAVRAGTAPGGGPLPAGTEPYVPWLPLVVLVDVVLLMGLARWAERVVAEDLGQDYVHEQRRRLVGAALSEPGRGSLGVTVTRASNDLTAVRAWVSQGLVPLLTSIPLIGVVLAVLTVTSLPVGLAVGAPILLVAAGLPWVARITYERARRLRRQRGRMSGRIADSVQAGASIVAAGGVRRELNALDRDSTRVVEAAVARAEMTGLVRTMTLTAASLSTVGVVVLGALGHVDTAAVASAMTLVGVLAGPLGELGRVVEYRQNYRAARRIQAPLLARAEDLLDAERARERAWPQVERRLELSGPGGLFVEGLVADDRSLPPLRARAGEVVAVTAADPGRVSPALGALLAAGGAGAEAGTVVVDGYDYSKAPSRERRRLLGHASVRHPLERGSVRRLATYRDPDAGAEQARAALERVGLLASVEDTPQGLDTVVKNGGRPLSASQAARLKLARALHGDPPLLVLDGIDAELDAGGLACLRRELADYPGVVLLAAGDPDRVAAGHRVWSLDA